MKEESRILESMVGDLYKKYSVLADEFCSIQLSEDKWSVKEIFGHLVDSAANNYQRFIRLQEETELTFPGYGISWIKTVPYNSYPFASLLILWREYNLLLCHIIGNIDEGAHGNIWKTGEKDLTLEFLVKDYISHLKLHIDHLEDRMKELQH